MVSPKKGSAQRVRRESMIISNPQSIYHEAENISTHTHFTTEECKSLMVCHNLMSRIGMMERRNFREVLHSVFDITSDISLDLTVRAFDRNNSGFVSAQEWVKGLSVLMRGTLAEYTDWCYNIYDINGDRSLAREELFHCLRGCMSDGLQYGILDEDEMVEAERDIVEICMKKLDYDHDGQITLDDFRKAIKRDPLMLQACGSCLPSTRCTASFLSIMTDNYRSYTGVWKNTWIKPKVTRASKSKSSGFIMSTANSRRRAEGSSRCTVSTASTRTLIDYDTIL